MRILGIETSCDDTSSAIVDTDGGVLSNVIASQDDIHAEYGGIVPELAARRHLETISRVIRKAIADADAPLESIDAIAVTRGPGLVGSLLVGMSAAQGLALRTGLPLYGVNHLEGHLMSIMLAGEIEPPFLALLASGGHSTLYLVNDIGDYKEIGSTRDDSAGEAFDKAAKMLGLGFPGGKVIDDLAKDGDPKAFRFPRGRVKGDEMALSFSGLKTSLWDFLSKRDEPTRLEDVCASFQEAIVDVLLDRCTRAMDALGVPMLAVVGGVSANSRLRERFNEEIGKRGGRMSAPPLSLCTDNAAMIAEAARQRMARGLPGDPLAAKSRLPLGPRLEIS